MHCLRALSLCLPLALTVGCASVGVIHSLDDVTAQVDQKGFMALEQQRLLSLSGLIPAGPPGSAYRFRAKRSPFTAVGIAPPDKDSNVKGTKTHVLRRSVAFDGTHADLVVLRNLLEAVRADAAELIVAQLQLAVARGGAVLEREQDKVAAAETNVEEKRKAFQKSRKAVVESIDKPGIMVVRTNTIRRINLLARIGAFFGLSAQRDEERSGFAILADLETDTLYVGTDFETWCVAPGKDWGLIGRRFPFVLQTSFPFIGQTSHQDVRVVTSRFAAKHVLYTSDQLATTSIQAKLELTEEALEELRGGLSAVDRLAIEAVLESVESLGSIGILGAVKQTKIDLPTWSEDCSGTCARSQVIYEVLTEYDDVEALASRSWRLRLLNL